MMRLNRSSRTSNDETIIRTLRELYDNKSAYAQKCLVARAGDARSWWMSTGYRLPYTGNMRVLVVHNRLPRPEQSGSDVRLMQILSVLREIAEVTLVLPWMLETADSLQHLEALGIKVLHEDAEQLRYYGIDRIPKWSFKSLLRTQSYEIAILTLWFWNAFTVPEQYLPQIRLYSPDTKVLILSDDQHGRRELDLAGLLTDPLAKERAEDIACREQEIYLRADGILTVSREDQAALASQPSLRAPVWHIPFGQLIREHSPSFLERSGLLFLGNFTNPCVSDCAQWLVSEICPLIHRTHPEINLTLAGYGSEVFAEHSASNIRVLGFVDDLNGLFDQHRLFVCPLRVGTGIATKNIMAMSSGLPVITTDVGAHGLGADARSGPMIAITANVFAEATVRCYEEPQAWKDLQMRCRALVSACGPHKVRPALVHAIQAVLQTEVVASSSSTFSVRAVDDFLPSLQHKLPQDLRRASRVNAHLCLAEELIALGFNSDARQQLRHALNAVVCFQQGLQYVSSILTLLSICHASLLEPHKGNTE